MTATILKAKILLIYPAGNWGLAFFYKKAFEFLGCSTLAIASQGKRKIDAIRNGIRSKIIRYFRYGINPNQYSENLIESAKAFRPNITIVFRCECFSKELIKELNNLSSSGCFNIYPDAPFVIPGSGAVNLFESIREYSAMFTFSRNLIPVFYQLGARHVEWLPFAYCPEVHRPVKKVEHKYISNLSYVGTWGPLQEKWLTQIDIKGLKIYGTGWNHLKTDSTIKQCWMKGIGIGPDMRNGISGAKITFNLIRAEHGCAHSMKTFEIPACGGLMLTNWTEEQEVYFKNEKECVYFSTIEELLDKIDYYLSHESERENVRLNGMSAVYEETYTKRALEIIKLAS